MDRRSLLKAAAALPAVVALPPAVAEPVVHVAPEAAAAIVPAKLNPYANYVWQWFVSHDGDVYYESFPTKEEAEQYAKQCDYSIIAECMQKDFDLSIQGWRIVEMLNEDNYENIGEGEGIECTAEQERDLEVMVQKAIEAWVVKHNINITAWTFDDTRNKERVEQPAA